MSYEGYEEHLCKNGHRFSIPCQYAFGDMEEVKCQFCNEHSVWFNAVDQTNCDEYGAIQEADWEKFLIEPTKTETCSSCNHTKVISEARYRIPTKEELKNILTMMDSDGRVRYLKDCR